jgi:hypothetical protein
MAAVAYPVDMLSEEHVRELHDAGFGLLAEKIGRGLIQDLLCMDESPN